MNKQLSPQDVRNDMPITRRFIYADNAATTPVPIPVQEAMNEYFNECGVNIDRGLYSLSFVALAESEKARQNVSELLGCRPEEFLFTKNCTEAINQVAYSLEHPLLNEKEDKFNFSPRIIGWQKGDNLVTTLTEHHSNFLPWLRLARRLDLEMRMVSPDKKGFLSPENFGSLIDEKTRFIAFQHVSNVTGCIHPVREIIKEIRSLNPKVLILLDGSQAVGHIPVNFKELNCDFYAFSGHKGPLGPQGSGGLCARKKLLGLMEPISIGGGVIDNVTAAAYKLRDDYRYKRFEAGTPAIASLIGLGRAAQYVLDEIGIERIAERENQLIEMLYNGLSRIKGISIYGPEGGQRRTGLLSFNIKGYNCIDLALSLDENWKILTRAGHHCCLNLARFLKVEEEFGGSLRISLHYFNTEEEVEKILKAIQTFAHG